MFRKMRRLQQQLSAAEAAAILEKGTAGVLALAGDDGYPYAVPLSYAFLEGKLLFHSARTGHKLDAIAACDKASFCVIDQDQVMPAEYTTYFRSVIAFGRIRVLADPAEIRRAANAFAARYRPGAEAARQAEIERELPALCMLEMTIEHLTGKEAIELTRAREG